MFDSAGESEIRRALLELTKDERSGTRVMAVAALKRTSAEPLMMDRLMEMTNDEEWVASYAIEGLARAVQQPKVWKHLLTMTNSPSHRLAAQAVAALGGVVSEPEVCQRLLALTNDPELRDAAADALVAALGNEEVWRRVMAVKFAPATEEPEIKAVELFTDPPERNARLRSAAKGVTTKMLDELSKFAEESREARRWLEVLVGAQDAQRVQGA